MVCHGVADFVIVNGRVCVDDGQLRVAQGYGRYIETPTHAPFVYDPEKVADLKPLRNGNHDDQITGQVDGACAYTKRLDFSFKLAGA